MKRIFALALGALLPLLLSGCFGNLNKAYVLSDAQFYNAVVPRQRNYLRADTALKDEDKKAYEDTLNSKRDVLKETGFVDYDEAADHFTPRK